MRASCQNGSQQDPHTFNGPIRRPQLRTVVVPVYASNVPGGQQSLTFVAVGERGTPVFDRLCNRAQHVILSTKRRRQLLVTGKTENRWRPRFFTISVNACRLKLF